MSILTEINRISGEVGTQTSLISQIQTALEGKAAGGGGGSGLPTQEKTENVTVNGTVEVVPDAGYTMSKVTVNVNVPDVPAVVEELNVTENGEYTPGNGVDGFSKVTVNVASSGGGEENQLDSYLEGSLANFTTYATKIAGHIFRNVTTVKQITAPNCTSIGTYAFYYATNLTKFVAPKVTSLGTYCFYNCSVAEFDFPEASSVTSNCFNTVVELKKADFGKASSIAAAAFAYCENLTTLILRRTSGICSLANKNALVGTPIEKGTGYIYVPRTLADGRDGPATYAAASNWSNFASQFRAIEDYPDITGG